ncbi:NACHT domain-containing protein [Actinosynnema sp. NPDC004786]
MNGQPSRSPEPMHHNEVLGTVNAPVVQARDVHGDVVVTHTSVSTAADPLHQALLDATVVLSGVQGDVRGVRVAPGQVLTLAAALGLGDGLALVTVPRSDRVWAAVRSGAPPAALRVVAGAEPGSPVLDRRTGGVCGLVGPSGDLLVVPELPDLPRRNDAWLDLLDPPQLTAGGWRHAGPVLREYLEAVRAVDEEHEYDWARLAAPPLSKVYLRRHVTPRQGDEWDQHTAPERIVAEELVTRFEGVQVVAEPGAGKSSLVRRITAVAARRWLEDGVGDFVPVPVTAESLVHHRSLPEALADGILRGPSFTLDRNRLVELFGGDPVPGVRWLVLVDGLDEVLDPHARAAVVRRVEDHRRRSTHRFLVTSRPLHEREMRPLLALGATPTYVLRRFSETELLDFARRWLEGEGHPAPERGAVRFLAEVRRAKLRDLAHVPLVATMLCVLLTEDTGHRLPDSQAELYRRFVMWQLTKVHDVDARARLLDRLAPHGPAARRAADFLLENLEVLLQDIARRRLFEQDASRVLDLAIRWNPGVAVWPEVVPDVLRLSGLVVQRGHAFAFRHQTIEEFLAAAALARAYPAPDTRKARHLLRPRRAWPWPDLAVMVFLAARWVEDGSALHRPLRRLMRPWHRRRNLGFVAALVDHGVALRAAVVDRATGHLRRLVQGNLATADWLRCAQWLHQVNPDRAVTVLQDVVRDATRNPDRRFQALRFLIDVSPQDGVPVADVFVADPEVRRTARVAVSKMLFDSDPAVAAAMFGRLARASPHEHLRLQGAVVVAEHDPDRGVDLLAILAGNSAVPDTVRLAAARAALSCDPYRGIDLMCVLIETAAEVVTREEAMNVVRHENRQRLETLLDRLRAEAVPVVRLQAAQFLVTHLNRDHAVLEQLASDETVPAGLRLEALLTDPRAMRADLLERVVAAFNHEDTDKLAALEHLARIDRAAAVPYYQSFVADHTHSPVVRLDVARLAGKHIGHGQLTELYEVIAVDGTVPARHRLTAAFRALEAALLTVMDSVVRLSRSRACTIGHRTPAAVKAGTTAKRV